MTGRSDHYSQEPTAAPRSHDKTLLATAVFVATLLVVLLGIFGVAKTNNARLYANWSGQTLADGLALMSSATLFKQDYLALTVLANRFADHPGVANVALYTVGNEAVAAAGNEDGVAQSFTAPVMFENEMIGFVRVDIRSPASLSWLVIIAIAFGSAVLVTGAFAIANSMLAQSVPVGKTDDAQSDDERETEIHFLTVNLYNQISMQNDQRDAVLAVAMRYAEQVAHLYRGAVYRLPDAGIAITFVPEYSSTEPDPVFEEICAAFVLMQVLNLTEFDTAQPQFRFALHASTPSKPEQWISDEDLADAGLLSAIVPNEQLAVSAHLIDKLRHPERLDMEPLTHPILSDASHLNAGGWLVTSMHDRYWALVAQQSERLIDETTSIPTRHTH